LAFWRNTWDVEKERAIQETVSSEKKSWEASMAIRTDARVTAAQQEWNTHAERRESDIRRDLESTHALVMESLLAKHEAELSAVSSAYEVACELQNETQVSLSSVQEQLTLYKKQSLKEKKKIGQASTSKLVEVRNELVQIKGTMMALRREASAFQKTAPQLQQLRAVMEEWYGDEEWNEHDGENDPSPNCALNDPVIAHLMESWTADKNKLKLLRKWLQHVLANKKIKQTKSFRPGVELTKLSPEVCEGFLRIVVPMLRSRDDIEVSAYYRTRRETWKDLRLRVAPAGKMPPFVGGGTPVNVETRRSRALQSRSVGANATPTSSSLLSSSSSSSSHKSSTSSGGIRGQRRSESSDYVSTSSMATRTPLLQAPPQPSSVRRISGGSGRVRRHSSVDLGTPTWGGDGNDTPDVSGSESSGSRSSTPMSDVASSPWMQMPNQGQQPQGRRLSGGGAERQRRGSWGGPSSPRSAEQQQQQRPTQASRRLNLSKINNRLSKLRDVS
jgi:hypothetical protein